MYESFLSIVDSYDSATDASFVDQCTANLDQNERKKKDYLPTKSWDADLFLWKAKLEGKFFHEPYSGKNVIVVMVECDHDYLTKNLKRKQYEDSLDVWVVREDSEDLVADPELLDDMKSDYEIMQYYCVRFNVHQFNLEQMEMIRYSAICEYRFSYLNDTTIF